MKKLLAIILSITMLLSMATVAFADDTFVTSGAREALGIIKVGVNAEFPPFEYMENDKLIGFDIDLMNYIAARIGYGVEFVNMSFDKLIPAVINGEVDCAISAISVTEERESVVDFTRAYLTSENDENYAVVFPQHSVENAKLSKAAGWVSLYYLIDSIIEELNADDSINKLINKYELNKNIAEGNSYCPPEIIGWDETEFYLPSEWAEESIMTALKIRITDVGKNYNYRKSITREEFCELIYNYCYNVIKEVDTITGQNKFTDTTNSKIIRLNTMGIINGKSETEFAPNDPLTREEAAAILNRLINEVHPDLASTELYFEFADSSQISDWAMSCIQRICNIGIMKGVGNNNFAPKDTYTTEQAIATIVRVYTVAEASGFIDHNSSVGIIGGEDGPTSIFVGENVIEREDFENFYVEVTKSKVEVDDFYVDEALKLITESGKLAADIDFMSIYTTSDETTNNLSALGSTKFDKPTDIFYFSADRQQIIANIKAMAEAEGVDIEEMGDAWLEHLWKRLNFSTLASLINASYGSENLAALTILTNSRGYVMPKDFKNNFALFVQYEGDYSAIVSFYEYGDGVISANMSFVKNGDKDDVFRRMYEIIQGLGEGSIDIAVVK